MLNTVKTSFSESKLFFVNHDEVFNVWGAGEEVVALDLDDVVFFLE